MICFKCGNTIEDEAIFCPCCGERVFDGAKPVTAQAAVPTEAAANSADAQTYTAQTAVPTEAAANSADAQTYTAQTAVPTETLAKPAEKKEFFGVGAFIACLAVIALLAASTGTFAFLYFSAVGAL